MCRRRRSYAAADAAIGARGADHAACHCSPAASPRAGSGTALRFPSIHCPLDIATAEHQLIAERRHVGFVAHQLDVPGSVGHTAVEDAAGNAVVAQDDLLIHSALGVVQRDFLIRRSAAASAPAENTSTPVIFKLVKTAAEHRPPFRRQAARRKPSPDPKSARPDRRPGRCARCIRRPHRCRDRSSPCRRRRRCRD